MIWEMTNRSPVALIAGHASPKSGLSGEAVEQAGVIEPRN